MLAAELKRLGKDASKTPSIAPQGDENKVFDLRATPLELATPPVGVAPQGVLLEWTERVVGDYDQNGVVTISDLTPMANPNYWQSAVSYIDPRSEGVKWPSANGADPAALYDPVWRLARVDGDSNGLVVINDITPIAKHFGESITGYQIYRLNPDETETVYELARSVTYAPGSLVPDNAFGVHYAYFDEDLPASEALHAYQVAPADGIESEGPRSFGVSVSVPSDPQPLVDTGGTPPSVTLGSLGPASGDAPLSVFFQSQAQSSASQITAVLWDFDSDGQLDAATGRQPNSQHLFEAPGHYVSSVYVLEPGGRSAVAQLEIDVLDNGNSLPVAHLTATPSGGPAPLQVMLDASGSTDVEGVVSYEFDPLGTGEFVSTGPAPNLVFTYPEGEYDAVVRVRDTTGAFATETAHVSVGPPDSEPPTLAISSNLVGGEYAPETVTFSFTVDDPEGGEMTLEVDYEDDGIFDESFPVFDGEYNRNRIYSSFGDYTLRARLTDDHGLTDEQTYDFTLLQNLPPVAQLTADVESGAAPLTVNFDASGSSDPEGQALSYFWDFEGDGSYVGPLTAQESFTYHRFGIRGAWVRVVDSEGASSETAVAITTTSGWEVSTILSAESGVPEVSMAIVDGNPAIAYHRGGALYYARSDNPQGSNWSVAVLLHSPELGAIQPTLKVVNGAPAIAYATNAGVADVGPVYFIRANDAQGSGWESPVVVQFVDGAVSGTDLEVVNGRPAITWINSLGNYLNYCRAQDANGIAWGSVVNLGGQGGFAYNREFDMDIVGGNPTIVTSSGNSSVRYYGAMDADGTMWNIPTVARFDTTLRSSAAMAVVSGLPTVLYYNEDGLYATRSSDVAGTVWSTPVQIAAVDTSQWSGFGYYAPELEAKLVGSGLATLTVFSGFFSSVDAFGNSWNAQNGIFDGNAAVTANSYDIADIGGQPIVAIETSAGLQIARLR